MENQIMGVAEVQLVYKSTLKASLRPKINSTIEASEVLKQHWNYETIEFIEEFKLMLLSRANRVLGMVDISLGGTAGNIADPKIIFAAAIKSNASGIILINNRPSGNLKRSQQDLDLTRKIKASGQILDIGVINHLIITSEGYLSFTDEGMM